jgi:hypothetical protein
MDTVLSPPEFILDANDDNLIFSIPDEPVEIDENKTKETPTTDTTAKKKKNELYVNKNSVFFFDNNKK